MKQQEQYSSPETDRERFIRLMQEEEVGAARNAKASVFTDLFERPEYGVKLLKVLHPEMEFTEEDYVVVTLQNVIATVPYNDLGILARGHLLILVEAQSTFTVNILPRLLLYLALTYKNYIKAHELDVYSTRRIKLPKPEFYVVYTGKKKEVPEEIRFSEEFFDGEAVGAEITAKVIRKSEEGDVINQYITFSRVLDRFRKENGRTSDTARQVLAYCIEHNILTNYMKEKIQTEVTSLMGLLFTEKEMMELHDKSLLREGEKKGEKKGVKKGEIQTLIALVKSKKLALSEAAIFLGETEEKFRSRIK